MRALKITENFGQYVVETSAGVRATGASVESALRKLFVQGDPSPGSFESVAKVFAMIPDAAGPSQIGAGVASA
jgi:hypothetical protein